MNSDNDKDLKKKRKKSEIKNYIIKKRDLLGDNWPLDNNLLITALTFTLTLTSFEKLGHFAATEKIKNKN